MANPETKLSREIIRRIFKRTSTKFNLFIECNDILTEMNEEPEWKQLIDDALGSLNCALIELIDEIDEKTPLFDIFESELAEFGKLEIIPRYRRARDQKNVLRSDFLREPTDQENYRKTLLYEDNIQEYLLDDNKDSKKDSYFEKICAIFLQERYNFSQVGILRQSPASDGGLDFFGTQPVENRKPIFVFGQAKRRKTIDSMDYNDWIRKYDEGFLTMVEGKGTVIPNYALREGTEIQKKLKDIFPNLSEHEIKPALICAGKIPKDIETQVTSNPHNGICNQGIQFIQYFCLSISAEDPDSFNSWFGEEYPHPFIPEKFEEWIEEMTESLIIVDSVDN